MAQFRISVVVHLQLLLFLRPSSSVLSDSRVVLSAQQYVDKPADFYLREGAVREVDVAADDEDQEAYVDALADGGGGIRQDEKEANMLEGQKIRRLQKRCSTNPKRFFPITAEYDFHEIKMAMMHPEMVWRDTTSSGSDHHPFDEEERFFPQPSLPRTVPLASHIPFSRIKEILSPSQPQTFDSRMKAVVKEGTMLVKNLQEAVRSHGEMQGPDFVKQLSTPTLQHGLEFYRGMEEISSGTAFFQQIQADISQFYSKPREPQEVAAFQVQTQERLHVFSQILASHTIAKQFQPEGSPPHTPHQDTADLVENEVKDLMQRKEEMVGAFIELLVDGALDSRPDPDPDRQQSSLPVIKILPTSRPGFSLEMPPRSTVSETNNGGNHARDFVDTAGEARASYPAINDRRASLRPHYSTLPSYVPPVDGLPASYDPDAKFNDFFDSFFIEPAVGRNGQLANADEALPKHSKDIQDASVLIIPWRDSSAARQAVALGAEDILLVDKEDAGQNSEKETSADNAMMAGEIMKASSVTVNGEGTENSQSIYSTKEIPVMHSARTPALINPFQKPNFENGKQTLDVDENRDSSLTKSTDLGEHVAKGQLDHGNYDYGGEYEFFSNDDLHLDLQALNNDKSATTAASKPSQHLLDAFLIAAMGKTEQPMNKADMMQHVSQIMMDQLGQLPAQDAVHDSSPDLVVFASRPGEGNDTATKDFIAQNILDVSEDKVTVTGELFESIFGEEDAGNLAEATTEAFSKVKTKANNRLILLPLKLKGFNLPQDTSQIHTNDFIYGIDQHVEVTTTYSPSPRPSEAKKNFRLIVVNPFKDAFLPTAFKPKPDREPISTDDSKPTYLSTKQEAVLLSPSDLSRDSAKYKVSVDSYGVSMSLGESEDPAYSAPGGVLSPQIEIETDGHFDEETSTRASSQVTSTRMDAKWTSLQAAGSETTTHASSVASVMETSTQGSSEAAVIETSTRVSLQAAVMENLTRVSSEAADIETSTRVSSQAAVTERSTRVSSEAAAMETSTQVSPQSAVIETSTRVIAQAAVIETSSQINTKDGSDSRDLPATWELLEQAGSTAHRAKTHHTSKKGPGTLLSSAYQRPKQNLERFSSRKPAIVVPVFLPNLGSSIELPSPSTGTLVGPFTSTTPAATASSSVSADSEAVPAENIATPTFGATLSTSATATPLPTAAAGSTTSPPATTVRTTSSIEDDVMATTALPTPHGSPELEESAVDAATTVLPVVIVTPSSVDITAITNSTRPSVAKAVSQGTVVSTLGRAEDSEDLSGAFPSTTLARIPFPDISEEPELLTSTEVSSSYEVYDKSSPSGQANVATPIVDESSGLSEFEAENQNQISTTYSPTSGEFKSTSFTGFSSTTLDPEPLVVEVESPAESGIALLAASKALLKKLTMLAVAGGTDVPGSLKKLFEAFADDRIEIPAASTPTTTSTVQPAALRVKNFKHKKLANYYKTETQVDSDAGMKEEEEQEKMSLLASIRQQIIAHAVSDQNILAKANNIPRYYPARKVSKHTLKQYYKTASQQKAPKESGPDEGDRLAAELSRSLRTQLEAVKAAVDRDKAAIKAYEADVAKAVMKQLADLQISTRNDRKRKGSQSAGNPLTDSRSTPRGGRKRKGGQSVQNSHAELVQSLEEQLRAFYGDLQ